MHNHIKFKNFDFCLKHMEFFRHKYLRRNYGNLLFLLRKFVTANTYEIFDSVFWLLRSKKNPKGKICMREILCFSGKISKITTDVLISLFQPRNVCQNHFGKLLYRLTKQHLENRACMAHMCELYGLVQYDLSWFLCLSFLEICAH